MVSPAVNRLADNTGGNDAICVPIVCRGPLYIDSVPLGCDVRSVPAHDLRIPVR